MVNLFLIFSAFTSQATHNIKDKKQLLSFVNKSDKVIDVSDLKDAYPNVMEDLKVFIVFFLEIYTMSLCVLCFKIVLCCAVSKIFRRNLLVAIKH